MARRIGFVDGVRKADASEFLMMALGLREDGSPAYDVLKDLEEGILSDILSMEDWKPYATDVKADLDIPRWHRFMSYAYQDLVEKGLVSPIDPDVKDLGSAWWNLTPSGESEFFKIVCRWASTRFVEMVRSGLMSN